MEFVGLGVGGGIQFGVCDGYCAESSNGGNQGSFFGSEEASGRG